VSAAASHTGAAVPEESEAFRLEVRAFIAENAPAMKVRRGHRAPDAGDIAALRAWTAALYRKGYYGADWPPQWGGIPDADPSWQVIVVEELARANAPIPIGAGYLASRAILAHGTEEQKRRYLPRIRGGDDLWCQLFSEPDAGSDLASLRTTATRDGAEFVINGQKVWTTNGQHADLGFLLARTEPAAPKHAGITTFALDMRSPGVTVQPLREITGTPDFNEVFLEQVRVPATAAIGQPGAGWKVANEALAHERLANAGLPIRLQLLFQEVVELARARGHSADPIFRQELARNAIGVRLCRLASDGAMARHLAGQSSSADGPINKLLSSEVNVALTDLALRLGGPASLLGEADPTALDGGRWADDFLYARALPIAGGTNQVMRNVIAQRALGLPREPRAS
jgi:alkylation response protein AidB-like acyl-CoA dehydrogenase